MSAAILGRAALEFVTKHWRAFAVAVPVLVLVVLLHIRTGERDAALGERNQARSDNATLVAEAHAFAARVRETAAQVRSTYAQNTLRVERAQDQVSQEISSEYQARIDDLHRRVAALQLRSANGTASRPDPGGAWQGRPASLPNSARGSDAPAPQAGLPTDDAIIATEQAIQLDELQRWIRGQQAIDRSPPDPAGNAADQALQGR